MSIELGLNLAKLYEKDARLLAVQFLVGAAAATPAGSARQSHDAVSEALRALLRDEQPAVAQLTVQLIFERAPKEQVALLLSVYAKLQAEDARKHTATAAQWIADVRPAVPVTRDVRALLTQAGEGRFQREFIEELAGLLQPGRPHPPVTTPAPAALPSPRDPAAAQPTATAVRGPIAPGARPMAP